MARTSSADEYASSAGIRRLDASSKEFDRGLSDLLSWEAEEEKGVNVAVREILAAVQSEGDIALLRLTNQFDRRTVTSVSELCIDADQIQQAAARVPQEIYAALEHAAERIRRYHEQQVQSSWQYEEDDGTILGQKVTPLDRVGLYVPGGKAAYPSSVLMSAIPAKVAGVPEVVMVSPAPGGQLNDVVLAAAQIAEVDRVISIGGAQAVAALAYGTETVPKVDKIVGPGNIYVANAKREVFGLVDIDMIAGPSEILVLSDGKTNPDWVAMDLFSQAEHDELAQAILISTDAEFLDRVAESIDKLLPTLSRREVASVSIRNRGALILASDMEQALALVNRIAPEHLELSVENPERYLEDIRHAGAIFMGSYTSEALGDYCAGPNHVLPTSGTARFSSPLGVYDYVKRSSVIRMSRQGASELGKIASVLARAEQLEAHARSAEYRIED